MCPTEVDIVLCSCPDSLLGAGRFLQDERFRGSVLACDAAIHLAAEVAKVTSTGRWVANMQQPPYNSQWSVQDFVAWVGYSLAEGIAPCPLQSSGGDNDMPQL